MSPFCVCYLYLVITLLLTFVSTSADKEPFKQNYIVYLGAKINGLERSVLVTQHMELLQNVCDSNDAAELKLIHSYHRSFNGFAAELTVEEASAISEREDVVSVFPSKKLEMLTTRSWDFVGLTSIVKRRTSESEIIIGVLDSGIWPESESFSDKNLGPPPSKWKGLCQSSANFSCNNKIIGARVYSLTNSNKHDVIITPRDSKGHGTHVASIAAGVATKHTTSFYGLASGTARGAVPRARLAVYKICSSHRCHTIDILAAFDDAVADGVDIISASFGTGNPYLNYMVDVIAIGSFHAIQHGVLTVAAVGNSGPDFGQATNVAPWILSVAASTIDRKFTTKVKLGDGRSFRGTSINTFDTKDFYPLIWKSSCYDDDKDTRGKIVVCSEGGIGSGEESSGVKGYIIIDMCIEDETDVKPFPAVCLPKHIGSKIYSYINRSSEPKARIMKTKQIVNLGAPRVATFSSRGPNMITPDILKPDVTAPGVDILAAWPNDLSPTEVKFDHRITNFNILSGTSMSCPHVSGVAAYVKEFNPSFSPAAIKSAVMTTATPMSRERNEEGELAYGSGQINPQKAITPGLIYNLTESNYIRFLCVHGYKTKAIRMMTKDKARRCPKNATVLSSLDMNYPSLTLLVNDGSMTMLVSGTFYRTLTNVETRPSTYRVNVIAPPSLTIVVEPEVLCFEYLGHELSFTVKVTANLDSTSILSGSILWENGVHQVRSPVVAYKFRSP